MTFDPFGDFEARGYLRNVAKAKNPEIVRRLQHNSFTTGIDDAFRQLAARRRLSYDDVLSTHKILFEAVFPWAGEDRLKNAPGLAVSKGAVIFAYPQDVRRSIEYALKQGQDQQFMATKPGEVMGYLAYGHPFLDGNGRTIMVVHTMLAHRAGSVSIGRRRANTNILPPLAKNSSFPARDYSMPILDPSLRAPSCKAILPRSSRSRRALMAMRITLCSVKPAIPC